MNNILKAFSLNFILKVIGAFGSYLLTFLILKKYNTVTLGLFTLFVTILQILSIINRFGLETLSLRYIPKFLKNKKYSYLLNFYIYSVFFMILFFLFIVLNLIFFKNIFPKEVWSYLLFSILPFSLVFLNNQFIRSFNYVKFFIFFQDIFIFYITVIFIFLGFYPIISYIITLYILCIITFIFVYYVFNQIGLNNFKFKNNEFNFNNSLVLPKKSFFMMLNNSIFLIMGWVDTLMINYFLGPKGVGLYNVPLKISIIFSLIWVSFNSFSVLKFSYYKNNFTKLQEYYKTINYYFRIISFLLFVFLLLTGKFFLSFFGEEFVSLYSVLYILIFAQFFKHLMGLNIDLLNILGFQKVLFIITIFSIIINFLLNFIFIPKYGLLGAAIATAASMIFSSVCRFYLLFTLIKLHRR